MNPPSATRSRYRFAWRFNPAATTIVCALARFGCAAFDEPACQGFDNETSNDSVTVRVNNQSPNTLYFLSDNGFREPLSIEFDGKPVFWTPPGCNSCEAEVEGLQCTTLALLRTVVAIPPDASHDLTWPGTVRQQRQVIRGCAARSDSTVPCEQSVVAAAGTYSVTVESFDAVSCDPVFTPCSCNTSFPNGSCEMRGATPSAPHAVRNASFVFPNDTLVELNFE